MTAEMGAKLVSVSRTVGLATWTSVKELFSRSKLTAISKCIRPMPPKSQKQTFLDSFLKRPVTKRRLDEESDEEAERESTTFSAEEQKKI